MLLTQYFPLCVVVNDLSFEIKDSSNIIFCPLTIETKNSENNLNFFGKPIVLCTEIKKEKIFQYELIKVFTDIIKKKFYF